MTDDRGFVATRAEARSIWEGNARKWPFATSPWRPSAGDVAIYRRLAAPKAGGRALVLGSTPELRDLLAELGAAAVLIDSSRAMFEATSRLLRRADPSTEIWIEADWREVDLPASSFDFVLGDMIWWGVSVATQFQLRDAIHSALTPDGLFCGRMRFADPSARDEDPVPVVRRYLERLSDSGEDETRIEGELLSFAYDHTADLVNRRLDRERTRALLLDLAARPELSAHATFLAGAATRLVGADWTCQSRDELLDMLRPRFEIIVEANADDYESSRYPILALGKSERRAGGE